PVDRVRALGADVVIAAQPLPLLQPDAADPLGTFLGRAQRLAEMIPVRRLRDGIGTLNVSLRSFQALWYRLANASALAADAVVSFDLRGFWFLQFGEAARIVAAGREQAEEALPRLRTAI